MTITMPSPVDDMGNISFNRNEGIDLPVREIDSEGNPVDISAKPLYFIIGNGKLKKALSSDPFNPAGRKVTLTLDDLKTVQSTASFCLIDEESSIPIALWEGVIYERTIP